MKYGTQRTDGRTDRQDCYINIALTRDNNVTKIDWMSSRWCK